MIETRSIRWQCSGCDCLCALLTDSSVDPDKIVSCKSKKWRKQYLKSVQSIAS